VPARCDHEGLSPTSLHAHGARSKTPRAPFEAV